MTCHALIAADHIRGHVVASMSDCQPFAGRIGEKVEAVEFACIWLGRTVCVRALPDVPPLGLYRMYIIFSCAFVGNVSPAFTAKPPVFSNKRGLRWEASDSTDDRCALFSQRVIAPHREERADGFHQEGCQYATGVHGIYLNVTRVYTKSACVSTGAKLPDHK